MLKGGGRTHDPSYPPFSVCIIANLDTDVKGFVGILKIFLKFIYRTEIDLGIPYRTCLRKEDWGLREFRLGSRIFLTGDLF